MTDWELPGTDPFLHDRDPGAHRDALKQQSPKPVYVLGGLVGGLAVRPPLWAPQPVHRAPAAPQMTHTSATRFTHAHSA
jgi:hypothetical protein